MKKEQEYPATMYWANQQPFTREQESFFFKLAEERGLVLNAITKNEMSDMLALMLKEHPIV